MSFNYLFVVDEPNEIDVQRLRPIEQCRGILGSAHLIGLRSDSRSRASWSWCRSRRCRTRLFGSRSGRSHRRCRRSSKPRAASFWTPQRLIVSWFTCRCRHLANVQLQLKCRSTRSGEPVHSGAEGATHPGNRSSTRTVRVRHAGKKSSAHAGGSPTGIKTLRQR